ncbi:protein GPR107 isoform X2 [Euwallacea fornicatus]|uniref:protein GPR107 isoform X2 n=1 Tax=Euwallacea fornicatus TaxID=995702 RepID=UPI00338F0396
MSFPFPSKTFIILSKIWMIFLISISSAKIHQLKTTNDARKYIGISTFGFLQGGTLEVNLYNFHVFPENESALFGFTLDRTVNDGMNPYFDSRQDKCILEKDINSTNGNEKIIALILDLKNDRLRVKCAEHQPADAIHIYKSMTEKKTLSSENACKDINFDIDRLTVGGKTFYNASFVMAVETLKEEGLYNLFFHNCPNYNPSTETTLDFEIKIVEQNVNSFLSAGEMPLPALYITMALLFFLSGMFWVFLLKQSKHPVFKIHYMMSVLVFLKAISLAFHGVNYYYIEQLGFHLTTWAILFYVAHLLKGALLFVVLVLVGTGWTFIKHVLTPKDKKLFMVVIPLQVLANIAQIILEESEKGDREYLAWKNVVILVDLLCCGCILFPVVWSIRHLQEASQTDGKAVINLRKLRLFRHFYVMVVSYIYSTRIIVYLLKITVPFQYDWLHEMFREMATYVFFVLTAYKFRPASQNPYFSLSDEEDDDVNEVSLLLCGASGSFIYGQPCSDRNTAYLYPFNWIIPENEINCVDITNSKSPDPEKNSSFFERVRKADTLYADHMNLLRFPAAVVFSLPNLEMLDLSGNSIRRLPYKMQKIAPAISKLLMPENAVAMPRKRPLLKSASIKLLMLSKNRIGNIYPITFSKMPHLEILYLDGNRLKHVSADMFVQLPRLVYLHLGDNAIQEIPPKSLMPPLLRFYIVKGQRQVVK